MAYNRNETRQQAAERFIQSVISLTTAANLADPNLRATKMAESETIMRQALARVLCFDLPQPTIQRLDHENGKALPTEITAG